MILLEMGRHPIKFYALKMLGIGKPLKKTPFIEWIEEGIYRLVKDGRHARIFVCHKPNKR